MSRMHYDRNGDYVDRDATDEPEEVEELLEDEVEDETPEGSDETPDGSEVPDETETDPVA